MAEVKSDRLILPYCPVEIHGTWGDFVIPGAAALACRWGLLSNLVVDYFFCFLRLDWLNPTYY